MINGTWNERKEICVLLAMWLNADDAAAENLLCLTGTSEKANSRWGLKCGYGAYRVTAGGN
jgi:hypothetical protein